jgi:acyl-coenzyme A synthetase/AMP-(fatty) acid ligase
VGQAGSPSFDIALDFTEHIMSFATIYATACEHPSKSAVVYNGTAVSYAAFARAIGATRNFLESQELAAGDTVIVLISNLLDCWVAVLALQALGINTVCVGSTRVLEDLGLGKVAGILTTEVETPKHQLAPDAATGNRVITIPTPAFGSDELLPAAAVKECEKIGGHILYTSGTTGRYKKLFLAGDLQHSRDAEKIKFGDFNADTISHRLGFGLWTAAGYKSPPTVWYAKGCVIIDQRPDWHRHFLQSGMTDALLTPDLVNELLSSLDEVGSPTEPLDFRLTVTSGFISRELAEKILGRVTKNLRNLYASSETNVAILRSTVTDLDELHWLPCPENRQVEIVDEAGNICPINTEGQLRVRMRELDCHSYLDDPQSSEKVFRSGYFYPGDMAVQRADGRIRILGRSADVVNFRGQKLAVAPIEHNIQHHLGVPNVCLFSGISDEGEDEVVIAIESEHWPAQSELNNLGHEFAQFDQVRFAIVYPFPRTRTGTSKVDRIALRKLVFPVQ